MEHEAVNAAVRAAREPFHEWCNAPIEHRISIANGFAHQLRGARDELREMICEETGKPRWEAATEVDAMIAKVAISVFALHERRNPTSAVQSGVTAATRYKPHGVVAVLGPFNFPGHLPNGHIVPALLAGNTVVFKPSEHAPRVGRRMVQLWRAAGLPADVLQVTEGGPDVGQALVTHNDVAGVLFTGSFHVGRSISRALADRPGVIAALEMGGNNPLVVFDVKDLDAAAYLIVQSAYLSAGQRCSCARRLIVYEAEAAALTDALLKMIHRLRVGLHSDTPEPFMGPVINGAAAHRLLAAQDALISRGARAVAPLRPLREHPSLLSPGLIDVTDVKDRADEEHFGPLLQLIRVRDFDAAIAEANHTRFGLAAGLLSDDRSNWDHFYRHVRAGVVNWNRPLTGASSALPFGGIGDSGNHRPGAYFAADYCSYPVASLEIDRVTMPDKLTPGIDA